MRSGTGTGSVGLAWILGDHLGSTAITVDAATGTKLSEIRYKPWGEVRYEWGVTGTKYRFQGQRSTEFDLYDFNARFFDARLGRYVQPDSVVPLASQGVQAWDRYAGLNNNPLKYNDPTGHDVGCSAADPECEDQNTYTPPPPDYTDWYSGEYSGCSMCHYSRGTQYTTLTNTQLSEADNNARVAAGQATVAAVAGATIGVTLGIAGVGGTIALACGDLDCTNEVTAVTRTSNSTVSSASSAIVEYYPPNNGFQGTPSYQTLQPGNLVSRYGSTYGKFLSPDGTSAWARALPLGTENLPLNTYEVAKPFDVLAGPVAPWFGEIGGGMQYYTGEVGPTIQTLIELGFLIPK